MIDLNHRNPTEAINSAIDRGLVEKRKRTDPPRDYLGGSRLGVECERALQFEYYNAPPDDGKGFTGKSFRIFDVGHALEALAVEWLRGAGFDLRIQKPDGYQFGFETFGGRIRGHIDGVFVDGPPLIAYPALWECKSMGDKYWKDCKKNGVRKAHPVYYAQCQIYMAYMQLTDNPALFTAVNKNTQELLHEPVAFDADTAQKTSDKGVRVLQACDAGDLLPRISNDPTFFKCKWCNWNERCFQL